MNTYRFVLDIPANTQREAQAKLDLMLQLAAFFKDFNTTNLATSYLNFLVWNKLGKYLAPKPAEKTSLDITDFPKGGEKGSTLVSKAHLKPFLAILSSPISFPYEKPTPGLLKPLKAELLNPEHQLLSAEKLLSMPGCDEYSPQEADAIVKSIHSLVLVFLEYQRQKSIYIDNQQVVNLNSEEGNLKVISMNNKTKAA